MASVDDGTLRLMTERDLSCVLSWRNHPAIRRHMLTQHEITPEEHEEWFRRSASDLDIRLLVFHQGDDPAGFVHFSGALCATTLNWGFYAAPDAPKGTGRKLGLAALDYGFAVLHAHKVCGQALGGNHASIRFHQSLGFQQEGVLREQHLIDGQYHDLVCFGLLRHEWLEVQHIE
jgi:UDP-4-amino-4,6-dideoxy-N-acetyl-beta-L-altrosamine N-acetyltransferase